MLVEYKLSSKFRPSERQVWLMSRQAEEDGHVITRSIMNALDKGDIKYVKNKFYKLCKGCLNYEPIENFYASNRYILGVAYLCKKCTASRRRIRKYGVPHIVTDVGLEEKPDLLRLKISDKTLEAFNLGLENMNESDN